MLIIHVRTVENFFQSEMLQNVKLIHESQIKRSETDTHDSQLANIDCGKERNESINVLCLVIKMIFIILDTQIVLRSLAAIFYTDFHELLHP